MIERAIWHVSEIESLQAFGSLCIGQNCGLITRRPQVQIRGELSVFCHSKRIVDSLRTDEVNLPGADWSVNLYVGYALACRYCYASFMKRFTEHGEDLGSFVDVKYWPANGRKGSSSSHQ